MRSNRRTSHRLKPGLHTLDSAARPPPHPSPLPVGRGEGDISDASRCSPSGEVLGRAARVSLAPSDPSSVAALRRVDGERVRVRGKSIRESVAYLLRFDPKTTPAATRVIAIQKVEVMASPRQ